MISSVAWGASCSVALPRRTCSAVWRHLVESPRTIAVSCEWSTGLPHTIAMSCRPCWFRLPGRLVGHNDSGTRRLENMRECLGNTRA
jgi:hypothetical protein